MKFLFVASALVLVSCHTKNKTDKDWKVYGGSKAGGHYSSLTQIDTTNVSQLLVAWEYHTKDNEANTQIQVNPIVIDGILYGVSPKLKMGLGEKKLR